MLIGFVLGWWIKGGRHVGGRVLLTGLMVD